jgi:hypothetical protein
MITLMFEYEPEGLVEAVGDKLNVIERQVEGDLERFKRLVESRGYETGGWRGSVDAGAAPVAPGVEAAAASFGDKGKAGLSGKVKAVGAFAAAAGVVAAGALKGARDGATAARKNRKEPSEAMATTGPASVTIERTETTTSQIR